MLCGRKPFEKSLFLLSYLSASLLGELFNMLLNFVFLGMLLFLVCCLLGELECSSLLNSGPESVIGLVFVYRFQYTNDRGFCAGGTVSHLPIFCVCSSREFQEQNFELLAGNK